MRELLVTNDLVLLGYAEWLLADQDIATVVFDRHISLLEGSIGAFPCRLTVDEAHFAPACRVLADAGLSKWIKSDEQF